MEDKDLRPEPSLSPVPLNIIILRKKQQQSLNKKLASGKETKISVNMQKCKCYFYYACIRH